MRNPLEKKILFLRIKNQDKEAYGKFYDLYVSRIYRFIFFKVNSATDAQDLTSEVFLKLWQCLREGKEIRNLNAFVYMIARNSVVDFYRQKSRTEQSIHTENAETLLDESKDLLQSQLADSDLQSVLKGLNCLKDEYREIIVMRFLDELSIKEISEVLGKSKGAIRVLIHRALGALKKDLNHV